MKKLPNNIKSLYFIAKFLEETY